MFILKCAHTYRTDSIYTKLCDHNTHKYTDARLAKLICVDLTRWSACTWKSYICLKKASKSLLCFVPTIGCTIDRAEINIAALAIGRCTVA